MCRELDLLFILSVGLYLNKSLVFFFFPSVCMWGPVSIVENPGRLDLSGVRSLEQGQQTFCKGSDNKFVQLYGRMI